MGKEKKAQLSSWRRYPTWLFYVLVSVSYLYLISGSFYLLIPEAGHDDGLQLKLSQSLSSGHWLGNYDNLTLAKGITYPAWTALVHTLDIELGFANAILFIAAALIVVYSVRYFITSNKIRVLLYTLLLFNPAVSPRAYRDSIAPALAVLVIAWVIGLFLIAHKQMRTNSETMNWSDKRDIFLFGSVGAISLPAWWHLREDYFWLLPFIAAGLIMTAILVVMFYRSKHGAQTGIAVFMTSLMPFLVLGALTFTMAKINEHLYGRFVINDYISQDFTEAYSSLARIKDDSKPLTVPISKKMREEAYRVSPAFLELRDCLDNNGHGACEGFIINARTKGDYEGGWFFWALRQAVQEDGYYRNAREAEEYYKRLAAEINGACNAKKISCSSHIAASLTQPISERTLKPTLEKMPQAIKYVVMLQGVEGLRISSPVPADTNKEMMADYLDVRYSREEINFGIKCKNYILQFVTKVYKILTPFLTMLALVALLLASLHKVLLKKYWHMLLIAWGLLGTAVIRIFMITYVDVTAFPAIDTMYFSSLYPVVFLFDAICLTLGILSIQHIRQRNDSSKSKSRD